MPPASLSGASLAVQADVGHRRRPHERLRLPVQAAARLGRRRRRRHPRRVRRDRRGPAVRPGDTVHERQHLLGAPRRENIETPPATGAFPFSGSPDHAARLDRRPHPRRDRRRPTPARSGSAARSRSPRSPPSACSATRTRSGARSSSTTSGRSGTTRSSATSGTSSRGGTTGCPGGTSATSRFALNYRLGGLAHGGLPPRQRPRPRRERAARLRARPAHVPDAPPPGLGARAVVARDRVRRRGALRRAPAPHAGGRVRRPAAHLARDHVLPRARSSCTRRGGSATTRAGRDGDGSAAAPRCVATALLAMRTKEIAFTLPFAVVLYELSFLEGPARDAAAPARAGPRDAAGHPAHDAGRAGRGRRPSVVARARGEHARGHAAPAPRVPDDAARRGREVPRAARVPGRARTSITTSRSTARCSSRASRRPSRCSRRSPRLAVLLYRRTSRRTGAGALDPGGAARRVRHRLVLPRARSSSRRSSRSRTSCTSTGSTCRRSGSSSRRRRRSPRSPGGSPRVDPARDDRRSRARSSPRPVGRDAGAERGLGGRPVALVRRGAQVAAQAEAVREPRHRARALRPAGARRARPPAGGRPRSRLDLRPRPARGRAPLPRPQRRRRSPSCARSSGSRPRDPEALYNLATLLWTTDRRDEARGLFARFLEVAPPAYAAARRLAAARAAPGGPLTRGAAPWVRIRRPCASRSAPSPTPPSPSRCFAAAAGVAHRIRVAEERPYDVAFVPTAARAALALARAPDARREPDLAAGRPVRRRAARRTSGAGTSSGRSLEVVTDLDPRHGYAYQVGANMLSSVGLVDDANAILEKGIRNVPDRYILPFHRAVNAFLYEGDHAARGAVLRAARRARRARRRTCGTTCSRST